MCFTTCSKPLFNSLFLSTTNSVKPFSLYYRYSNNVELTTCATRFIMVITILSKSWTFFNFRKVSFKNAMPNHILPPRVSQFSLPGR